MRGFFDRIRYGFARFMSGRYGRNDALNFTLIGLSVVLDIVFLVVRIPVLSLLSAVPLGFAFFRILSRNTGKRYEENRKFVNFFKNLAARRTHHIYRCPKCSQKIRVPRKGGKTVEITCPKCGERFRKKI